MKQSKNKASIEIFQSELNNIINKKMSDIKNNIDKLQNEKNVLIKAAAIVGQIFNTVNNSMVIMSKSEIEKMNNDIEKLKSLLKRTEEQLNYQIAFAEEERKAYKKNKSYV